MLLHRNAKCYEKNLIIIKSIIVWKWNYHFMKNYFGKKIVTDLCLATFSGWRKSLVASLNWNPCLYQNFEVIFLWQKVYLCWLARYITLRKILIFVRNLFLRKLKENADDHKLTAPAIHKWCHKFSQPVTDIIQILDPAFAVVVFVGFMTLQ